MTVVPIGEARASGARSRRQAEREDRERRAVELHIAGCSYEDIARECGFSDRSGAYKAVRRGLERRNREPKHEHRAIVLSRYDFVFRSLAPLIEGNDRNVSVAETLRAAEIMCRANDRHAQLVGLHDNVAADSDAPRNGEGTEAVVPQVVQDLELVRDATVTMIRMHAWNVYQAELTEEEIRAGMRDDSRGVVDPERPKRYEDAALDLGLDDGLVSSTAAEAIREAASENATFEDDAEEAEIDDQPGTWRSGRFYPDAPGPQELPDAIGPPPRSVEDDIRAVQNAFDMSR